MTQQSLAAGIEPHRAALALEQRGGNQILQLTNGVADRTGGYPQLLTGGAKRPGAGGGFEGAQCAEGQGVHR